MSDNSLDDPFKIEFTKVEREGFPVHPRECFKVTFEISRGAQHFIVAVFVDDDKAVWEEVVRLAMHQLHQDFEQLARQMEPRRLSPEEIQKMA